MPSANIAFDTIPAGRRTPGVYSEFNTRMAVNTLPANQHKVVVVGMRLAAGTVAANVAADIFSGDDAATYFGRGSIAHLAVRAAIKANKYLSLRAIALDDAIAGVAASSPVTITGPATGNGALRVNINKQRVDIAIANADAANAIAAALNAQIALQPDLPVTAAVVGGVVTLTAKNKGTLGNAIKVSTECTAAGVAAAVVAMSGGLNDPDISTALTAIYNAKDTIVVSCFNDQTNLTALRTHLNAVSGALEKRRARGVYAHTGTYAQSVTLALALNSGRMLGVLVPNAYEASYEVAAAMAAVAASEDDPARPLNSLPLGGITPPPMANWLSETQIEAALNNGVTPVRVGPGIEVQIVRAVTTYTVNANSVPDISMLDWTTIGTLDYDANAIEQRIQLRFPRDKKSARMKESVRDEIYSVQMKCEELEFIENVSKDDILIENDLVDPSAYAIRIKVDVVNGMHVVAMRLDLVL